MRKLTTLVVHVIYVLIYITGNKTSNIDMSDISETLKCHYFDVVTSEILDFGGHRYEEIKVCNDKWIVNPRTAMMMSNKFFLQGQFWSTYFWSSDLWNPWFWRSQVWWNKKFVITNELPTQDYNDDAKQVFSTKPVFGVPTFEVVTKKSLVLEVTGMRK